MKKENTMCVSLQVVTPADIPIITTWLDKDHINRWYGDTEDWLKEITDATGEFAWIKHFMVLYQGAPIGFCQYFNSSNCPKGFEWDNEPEGTFGIDYMIGEEAYLGKGFGSAIVKELMLYTCSTEKVKQLIADPVSENLTSIKLLEKHGFVYDEKSGLYKLEVE